MTMKEKIKITCWGSRGSCPVPHRDRMEYGGNTSCFVIEAGDEILILDAGTGLVSFGEELLRRGPEWSGKNLHIFLSHLHLDHIIGIPFFKPLNCQGCRICFYGEEREGRSLKEQLETVFAPPYWPIGPDRYAATVSYMPTEVGMSLAVTPEIHVKTMRASHPDQTMLYAFYISGRKIVYALDCEMDRMIMEPLTAFAESADLFICDAQYSPGEYEAHRGWGHSTWRKGSDLARRGHIKNVWFSHFAWEADDRELERIEREAIGACPQGAYVREGMELWL